MRPYTLCPRDYMFRQRDELYRQVLPRGRGRSILEVGCAPGDWLVYFYWELGLTPVGIDFAPDGARTATQRLQHFGVPGEVICADFMTHDFGARRFDVVFFQGSLEHFADATAPLRRALSLCQDGGMVFAQIPCYAPRHLNTYLSRWLGRRALAEHHLRTAEDLTTAFTAAGLVDVQVEPFGTFQLVLEPDPDLGPVKRACARGAERVASAVIPLLNRLDIIKPRSPLSPHLLAYARRPARA